MLKSIYISIVFLSALLIPKSTIASDTSISLTSEKISLLKKQLTKAKHINRAEKYWNARAGFDTVNTYKIKKDYLSKSHSKQSDSKLDFESQWELLGPTYFDLENTGTLSHGRINRMLIDPIDPDIWYILSGSGGLWITRDNGETWKEETFNDDFVIGLSAIKVDPTNPNHIVVLTGDSDGIVLSGGFSTGLYETYDQGRNWKKIIDHYELQDNIILSDFEFSDTGDSIVVVGNKGMHLHILKDGAWVYEKELSYEGESANDFKQIIYIPEHDSYYTTSMGYFGTAALLKSEGGLNGFEVIHRYPNAIRIIMDWSISDPNYLYIMATEKPSENFLFLKRINCTNDIEQEIECPIGKDVILGQTGYNLSLLVSRQNNNNIYIGGVLAGASFDGGESWDTIARKVHVDHHSFFYDEARGRILSTNDGGVYSSPDGSENWINHSNGLNVTQLYAISQHYYHPDYLIGSTQDNGSMRRLNGNIEHVMGRDGMDAVISDTIPDHITFLTQTGVMGKSINGGETVDLYRLKNNLYYPFLGNLQQGPVKDEIFYGATELLRFPFGDSVAAQLTNIGSVRMINAFHVCEEDPNKIVIVKHDTLYLSQDGFNSYEKHYLPQTEVTHIRFVGERNDSLLLSFGLYNESNRMSIFHNDSFDDSIGEGLPQLPINSFVNLGNLYPIVAVSDMGVHFKESSDSNWELINANIPYSVVTDIEYSEIHGNLTVSTFGRGIWRNQWEAKENRKITWPEDSLSICFDSLLIYNLAEELETELELETDEVIWNDGVKGSVRSFEKDGFYWATGPVAKDSNLNFYTDRFFLNRKKKPEFYIGIANDENEDLLLCEGDSLVAFLYSPEKPGWENDVKWNNGEEGSFIVIGQGGTYYAESYSLDGCRGITDSVTIEVISPSTRKFMQEQDVLIAPDADAYRWTLNGEALPNDSQKIELEEAGYYIAEFSIDNCVFTTEAYLYQPYDKELFIYFSEINNALLIRDLPENTEVSLFDINGRMIEEHTNSSFSIEYSLGTQKLARGAYFLHIYNEEFSLDQFSKVYVW